MLLEGKRILIVGSSRGIGLAIAELFLKNGAKIVINSRKRLEETKENVKIKRFMQDFPENCFYISGDFSILENSVRVIEEAFRLMGGMDCLIYNAGICISKHLKQIETEDYEKIFNVNFKGAYFAAKKFAELVGQRNNDASLIFTGSINGVLAEKNSSLYDASKGAIHMLVKSLALDLAEQGIRVNCVAPGFIATDLTKEAHTNPIIAEKIAKMIPMKRIGIPEDNAGAYLFFASEELSSYVTGQILFVDGGISASQGSPIGED